LSPIVATGCQRVTAPRLFLFRDLTQTIFLPIISSFWVSDGDLERAEDIRTLVRS